ncbi:MAG: hypothetical protein PWQ09_660 [Candidatus Cloacimonadota bacterium]|jgi:thiamine kinase-like enzyme|nr:hypothetical protein [Candidatus Cloacimonadota bacterium]
MKTKILFKKEAGEVIKICNSPAEFQKEVYIYQKNLDFTPKLIDHDGRIKLILQFIPGETIAQIKNPDFSELAKLFLQLHRLEQRDGKVICHIDTNPRNYIKWQQQYYMLDFAEWQWQLPEVDLINFLLFYASEQQKDQFRKTCESFLRTYHEESTINVIEWELLLAELILKFDRRRKIFCKKEHSLSSDVNINRNFLKDINQILY